MSSTQKHGKRRQVASPRAGREWASLIKECEDSGMEARGFCEERGLSFKSFKWWRWALRTGRQQVLAGTGEEGPMQSTRGPDDSDRPPPQMEFVEVVRPHQLTSILSLKEPESTKAAAGAGVDVVVRPGQELVIRVDRGFDSRVFSRVVRLVQEVTRC